MDQSDNISGIEGVGAGKKGGSTSMNPIVQGLWKMINPTEEEMFQYVKAAYINKYGNAAEEIMTENYILLNMLSKPCFDYPTNPKLTKCKTNSYNVTKLIDI